VPFCSRLLDISPLPRPPGFRQPRRRRFRHFDYALIRRFRHDATPLFSVSRAAASYAGIAIAAAWHFC